MMLPNKLQATTIIEILLSTTIGIILCSCALHCLFLTTNVYYKMRQQNKMQIAKLIARYYLNQDLSTGLILATTCQDSNKICQQVIPHLNLRHIKPFSNILVLQTTATTIVYYLHKSAVPQHTSQLCYALYRDDIKHNAIALVENLSDLQAQIVPVDQTRKLLKIKLIFDPKDALTISWPLLDIFPNSL